MAIAGTMLVMSSVCQSTSNSATSLLRPLSVAMSIWRTEARQSLDKLIDHGRRGHDLPAFAWLVMRFAVCTAEPKISRFSQHHRAEIAADADGHRLLVDFELRVQ